MLCFMLMQSVVRWKALYHLYARSTTLKHHAAFLIFSLSPVSPLHMLKHIYNASGVMEESLIHHIEKGRGLTLLQSYPSITLFFLNHSENPVGFSPGYCWEPHHAEGLCFSLINPGSIHRIRGGVYVPGGAAALCWFWVATAVSKPSFLLASRTGFSNWVLWFMWLKKDKNKHTIIYCRKMNRTHRSSSGL